MKTYINGTGVIRADRRDCERRGRVQSNDDLLNQLKTPLWLTILISIGSLLLGLLIGSVL